MWQKSQQWLPEKGGVWDDGGGSGDTDGGGYTWEIFQVMEKFLLGAMVTSTYTFGKAMKMYT